MHNEIQNTQKIEIRHISNASRQNSTLNQQKAQRVSFPKRAENHVPLHGAIVIYSGKIPPLPSVTGCNVGDIFLWTTAIVS